MASRLIRAFLPALPIGATALFPGTIFADSPSRPHPAAVYAEAQKCPPPPAESSKQKCSASLDGTDTELERLVMKAREELGPFKDTVWQYGNDGIRLANCYYDKFLSNLCYLRTRAPEEIRIGTVAAGSITGLLLGLRGGIIKKLFMTAAGTGVGAYIAYPNETERYTKKYTAIAYNFIAGTGK